MNRLPHRLLPLASTVLVALLLMLGGCQKDVQEVRRTKPSVDGITNGYAVDTGGHYTVDSGHSGADSGRYSVNTGGRYTVDGGGSRPGAPAAPGGAPVGIGGRDYYQRR